MAEEGELVDDVGAPPPMPAQGERPGRRKWVGCSALGDFELLGKVGEGTFGVVYRGRHRKSGKAVALKRILPHAGQEGFPTTALREIALLRAARSANVVELLDVAFDAASDDPAAAFYMVLPYMEHDLAGLLASPEVSITVPAAKCYARQLLEAVKALHARGILHRDVKAANVLINNRGELRLTDLGLARRIDPSRGSYTPHVVTRWYRPPELLFGATSYGTAVDMWGVGCVLAEMATRRPLFPGTSDVHQLELIARLCGTPSPPPGVASSLVLPPFRRRVRDEFGPRDPLLADLLDGLLALEPGARPSAEDALRHAYFRTHPLPALPQSLPAWPSCHELGVAARAGRSPPPAPTGAFLPRGDSGAGGTRDGPRDWYDRGAGRMNVPPRRDRSTERMDQAGGRPYVPSHRERSTERMDLANSRSHAPSQRDRLTDRLDQADSRSYVPPQRERSMDRLDQADSRSYVPPQRDRSMDRLDQPGGRPYVPSQRDRFTDRLDQAGSQTYVPQGAHRSHPHSPDESDGRSYVPQVTPGDYADRMPPTDARPPMAHARSVSRERGDAHGGGSRPAPPHGRGVVQRDTYVPPSPRHGGAGADRPPPVGHYRPAGDMYNPGDGGQSDYSLGESRSEPRRRLGDGGQSYYPSGESQAEPRQRFGPRPPGHYGAPQHRRYDGPRFAPSRPPADSPDALRRGDLPHDAEPSGDQYGGPRDARPRGAHSGQPQHHYRSRSRSPPARSQ